MYLMNSIYKFIASQVWAMDTKIDLPAIALA